MIMRKNNHRKTVSVFITFCLSLAFLPLFSCASQINGTISADGSATLSLNAAIQQRMTAMINSMNSAAGRQNELIIDGMAIAGSIHGSAGVESILLINTSPSAVEGMIKITALNEFLNSSSGNRLISFDQTAKRCQINLDRGSVSGITSLLSAEFIGYLNALMAPVVTGESMTQREYLELIEMFYSRAISDEIAGSYLRVSIEFPGTISGVTGGTFSGRRADFNIPLLDILVLETPLAYQVSWN